MTRRDLFVVVADLDTENAVRSLLCERQASLGIKLGFNPDRPPDGDLLRYSGQQITRSVKAMVSTAVRPLSSICMHVRRIS